MHPSYVPEPYATIIKRLGNAYDSGFFMNGACVCLAVILKEAAEQQGHPAQIKLVMEDALFLHHAFIEVTVDGTVFDLDIKGRSAEARAMKGLDPFANVETCRDRETFETNEAYLVSLAKELGTAYHLEDIAGRNDPSKSFSFIRNLAFNHAEALSA